MAETIVSDAERVRELLDYNPETGDFISLGRGRGRGSRYFGCVVGYRRPDGYVAVYFGKKQYLAHLLAWLWMTGEWPKNDVDHINRNRSDNRWSNLRDVTR